MKKLKTVAFYSVALLLVPVMLTACDSEQTSKQKDEPIKEEVVKDVAKKVSRKSYKLSTDKESFFEAGKDFPAGEYKITSIDGKVPTIFFVWNTEGNKFISEILGDDDIQEYRINLTEGMELAAWNSPGIELTPVQEGSITLTPGYYTLSEAGVLPGEYELTLTDELGKQGSVRIIDKDGKQAELIDKIDDSKKVKIDKDEKIKVSGNVSARLTLIEK